MTHNPHGPSRVITLAVAAITAFSLTGCAESWDDVSLQVEDISMDGETTVTATVVTGPCQRNERLVITETDVIVTVAAMAERSSGDCDDVGHRTTLQSELRVPLGSREVRLADLTTPG